MKPNQQEKCAHKKNLGESCSQCNEAWNDMTSPHQEGWAERLETVKEQLKNRLTEAYFVFSKEEKPEFKRLDEAKAWYKKHNYIAEKMVGSWVDNTMVILEQELTTLHKADCERFREMIPKKMTMSAANKTRSEAGAGYTIGYNGLIDKLNTALQKFEEEKV